MQQPAWRSTGNAIYPIPSHFVGSTPHRRAVLASAGETTARSVL